MSRTQKALLIRVLPVDGKPGEYAASFTSEFLQATFSVEVKDTILGAVAIHRFAEMVRKEYARYTTTGEIEFVLPPTLESDCRPFAEIVHGKEIRDRDR